MQPLDFKRFQAHSHFKNTAFAGTLALRYIKQYFDDPRISGTLHRDKLFINTSDQFLKIEIFKKKRKLLSGMNEKLKSLGYALRIQDLYIRSQGVVTGEEEFM